MDGPASRKRPRPRPVVSCLRCRDKKLKCDRAAPCQNCTKAACAAACTYNQHPTSNSSSPSVPRPAPKRVHLDISEEPDEQVRQNLPQSIGIIEDLQRRVVHLEELVGAQNASANFTPPGATTIQNSWLVPAMKIPLRMAAKTSPATTLTLSKAPRQAPSYYSCSRHVGC